MYRCSIWKEITQFTVGEDWNTKSVNEVMLGLLNDGMCYVPEVAYILFYSEILENKPLKV